MNLIGTGAGLYNIKRRPVGNPMSIMRSWMSGTIYLFSRWRLNPTKLLPLTSQTKLTLFVRTLLTPARIFFIIYKRNFLREQCLWVGCGK